jgi:hypothetical protein
MCSLDLVREEGRPGELSHPHRRAHAAARSLWVPETVQTALDLLLRRQPATGMIRR